MSQRDICLWMQRLLNHALLWRCIFYPLTAFILFLSTTSRAYPIPSSPWDKANHFAAFLVLAFMLDRAHQRLGVKGILIALGALGMAIEVIQYFLPYRDFSLLDWLADMTGVVIGLGLIQLARTIHRRWQISR